MAVYWRQPHQLGADPCHSALRLATYPLVLLHPSGRHCLVNHSLFDNMTDAPSKIPLWLDCVRMRLVNARHPY
jgi:hypothetical protein